MKPTIFVGSSTEGLPAAQAIQRHLEGATEVTVWSDNIFAPSTGLLDTLLKCIERFDFAIFIFTADDIVESRATTIMAPRDNVIFELGMCFGRLGPRRTFAVCQAKVGMKIPSDLAGISIPHFDPGGASGDLSVATESLSRQIVESIRKNADQSELRLLPSTALAIGYFQNFIKPVCNGKLQHRGQTFDLQRSDRFKLVVLIPEHYGPTFHVNLPDTLKAAALEQVTVDTGSRGFPFYIRTGTAGALLELYDIPTTLSVLPTAIRLHLGKQCVGSDVDEKRLQTRELTNFRLTLERLAADPEHWRIRNVLELRDLPIIT